MFFIRSNEPYSCGRARSSLPVELVQIPTAKAIYHGSKSSSYLGLEIRGIVQANKKCKLFLLFQRTT